MTKTVTKKSKRKVRQRGVRGRGTVFERKTKTEGTKWVTSISYVDWNGVRHRPQLTFATREQALAATKFLEVKRDGQAKIAGSAMTVTQLVRQWMNANVWEENTRTLYEGMLNNHVLPYMGKKRLVEIDPAMIDDWVTLLRHSGVKTSALRRTWGCLSQALKYAIHPLRVIKMHPMSGLPVPRHQSKPIVPFTPEEMDTIFSHVAGTHYEPLLKLVYLLGLRQGEVYGLKWSDLNEEKRELTIQRQMVVGKSGKKVKDKLKTKAANRLLVLSDNHMEVIAMQREICRKLGKDSEYMFINRRGNSIHRGNFWVDFWAPLLATLKIPQRGLHHFRHTAATDLVDGGAAITEVSSALGHSKPGFTMQVYVHNRIKRTGTAFGTLSARTAVPDNAHETADRQRGGGLPPVTGSITVDDAAENAGRFGR